MIQSDDRMCGGFVWEWCDHAIAEGYSENGKVRYLYGGDHGENIHDGNFCVDGLVYPDRRPHTGLLEYKNVYRPARVVTYEQESGRLVLHNYMDFDNLEDYAEIAYEVTLDGVVIRSGKLETISVAPHRDGQIRWNLISGGHRQTMTCTERKSGERHIIMRRQSGHIRRRSDERKGVSLFIAQRPL